MGLFENRSLIICCPSAALISLLFKSPNGIIQENTIFGPTAIEVAPFYNRPTVLSCPCTYSMCIVLYYTRKKSNFMFVINVSMQKSGSAVTTLLVKLG